MKGFNRRLKFILAGIAIPLFLFIIAIYLVPLPGRIVSPDYSTVVKDRNGRVLRVFLTKDEKRRVYVPIKNIDPLLINTTIVYEDRFYYYHPGVNPVSIVKAALLDIKEKRIVSGASTIPMQLARIVEPRPRTFKSKIIEAFRAIQYVIRLGKKKTLELYLNLAPYGGNIEGVGAASLSYFGKLPYKLRPGEIAFLVSLPQSPAIRWPGSRNRKDARDKVLKRMLKYHLISKEDYRMAFEIPVPQNVKKFPFYAPHICELAKKLYPNKREITLSIDLNTQRKCENILRSYKYHCLSNGATNASVVVIDNKTSELIAAIGSFDYFDGENQGQVNGFFSYRSPGSALKPFLYALALQSGVITTKSLIEDAPYNLNGFMPKNFSGKWHGLVKAEDALSLSLNMPFAILLKRTGYMNFVNLLSKAKIKGLLSPDAYGLAIITGGIETRLINLANLYACLARGGIYMDWSIVKGNISKKQQLLRYGACFLTLNALSKRGRPDAPLLKDFTIPEGKIYWKTGTSWGRRDAWSIGFKSRYTVGVWCGNFNGRGTMGIVGSNLAAPIMFDTIKAIDKGSDGIDWLWKGEADTEYTEVCSLSGYRPGEFCPDTVKVQIVKGIVPYRECPFHRAFLIERKTGKRACPEKIYRKGELEVKVMPVFPPLVAEILKRGFPPSYPPGCDTGQGNSGVKIISPINHSTYLLSDSTFKSVTFQAITSSKKEIFWFIDGNFVFKTNSSEKFVKKIKKGKHIIVAQTSDGASDIITVDIKNL